MIVVHKTSQKSDKSTKSTTLLPRVASLAQKAFVGSTKFVGYSNFQ